MLRAAGVIVEVLGRVTLYLVVIGLSIAARRVDRRRVAGRPGKQAIGVRQ
jgi:hypothetical protein